MSILYVLWLRQLKRYFRSRARVIGTFGQPLLLFFGLGFGFGPVFQKAGEGSYLQFLAPGIISMGTLFTGIFSGVEIVSDRKFGFLREMLVAPVSRTEIVLGQTLGGATVAVLHGVILGAICFAAGFRVDSPISLAMASFFLVLIAVLFTALGTAIASVLEDLHGFQLLMNFVLLPLFFFSNALYPTDGLPSFLGFFVRINPISYGVDGVRGALGHAFVFGMTTDLLVLGTLTALLVAVGTWLFSRIQL